MEEQEMWKRFFGSKNKRRRYERKVRKQIEKQLEMKANYPPEYKPEDWKREERSPYGYALNLKVADKKRKILIPGKISGEALTEDISSQKELMQRMKSDLDYLGLNYREDDTIIFEDEWRIAVYFNEKTGKCHFARQDRIGGMWSEVLTWGGKIQRSNEPLDWRDLKVIEILVLRN